ncbi:hypothetical protein F2P81_006830 [Scophthalmus maximus]|uniref:Uncharacterized protein n=1 Tax=Scophthalmus maximus TaxID=52904 RepID=A0A6A4TFH2_SCOMX|nr:hypothetical protein F2P81_006830 [Scophthalmus maximus]
MDMFGGNVSRSPAGSEIGLRTSSTDSAHIPKRLPTPSQLTPRADGQPPDTAEFWIRETPSTASQRDGTDVREMRGRCQGRTRENIEPRDPTAPLWTTLEPVFGAAHRQRCQGEPWHRGTEGIRRGLEWTRPD